MGFTISWLAIKGKDPLNVRIELGLTETEVHEEFPQSKICASHLANNWYLIYINQAEASFVSNESLKSLSDNCEVIACVVEEHVMYSLVQYWKNGTNLWKVSHDAQQGIFNLEASGQLPDIYEKIKNEMMSEQNAEGGEAADVDYIFEVPLLLANDITDFKHDEDGGLDFTVLNHKSARPWWKFW